MEDRRPPFPPPPPPPPPPPIRKMSEVKEERDITELLTKPTKTAALVDEKPQEERKKSKQKTVRELSPAELEAKNLKKKKVLYIFSYIGLGITGVGLVAAIVLLFIL